MMRDITAYNADKLEQTAEQIETMIGVTRETSTLNQQSVNHYTEWIPKYDEFQDPQSAMRAAEVAMRLQESAGFLRLAVEQMRSSLTIIREGEMR